MKAQWPALPAQSAFVNRQERLAQCREVDWIEFVARWIVAFGSPATGAPAHTPLGTIERLLFAPARRSGSQS